MPLIAYRTDRRIFSREPDCHVLPAAGRFFFPWQRVFAQCLHAAGKRVLFAVIAQEAVVPDAYEPLWNNMKEKSSDKLHDRQGHGFLLVAVRIILPGEGHGFVGKRDNAAVADCDTVRVSAKVFEHRLRSCERRLGIHHPIGFVKIVNKGFEYRFVFKWLKSSETFYIAAFDRGFEIIKHFALEQR